MLQKNKRPGAILGAAGLTLLFACCVSPPAASAIPAAQPPAPPSADARFSEHDAAARIDRDAALKDEGKSAASAANGSIRAGGDAPTAVIGIGNIVAPGRSAGAVVNQTEIRNSTIIIQTK